jgi:hypothetical protein
MPSQTERQEQPQNHTEVEQTTRDILSEFPSAISVNYTLKQPANWPVDKHKV